MPALKILIISLLTAALSGCNAFRSPDVYSYRGVLEWSDEFDVPGLNTNAWDLDLGGTGWGNNEWQNYTSNAANVHVTNGRLVITALYDGGGLTSGHFTSARLHTRGKTSFQYGRLEARIKLPDGGRGIWPAFWMLGDTFNGGNWPDCGEIDIMEFLGHEKNIIHGTVHGPGYSGAGGIGAALSRESGYSFADDFHVYAIDWEPNSIRWSVDGTEYHRVESSRLLFYQEWRFDRPYHILLNVAVGGNWPGYPDAGTVFPAVMEVDYIRYYR